MLHTLKRRLYFIVAAYFAFWAKFVLRRWHPKIILITGSSGKTTTMHLIEAQLGDKAIYSHLANSSIGIPFHILGMGSNVLSRSEWLARILKAPIASLRTSPNQKIYIVEADTDRPGEGKFISSLLRPAVTLWVSIYRTHSLNFDKLVDNGLFSSQQQAIAYDFGYYIAATSDLVIVNRDQDSMIDQLKRVAKTVEIKQVSMKDVKGYEIKDGRSIFKINGKPITVPTLLPPDAGISLQMINILMDYLGQSLDPSYKNFKLPPGRSNLLSGIKQTVLIDSSYNTGLGATQAVLNMFKVFPAQHKWLVLGDMLELGRVEQEEHELLTKAVLDMDVEQIILLGPRTKKFSYEALVKQMPDSTVNSFEKPDEVLAYLTKHLTGGEAILFKGGRYLEGVIEQLLADPADASKLVRREKIYIKRRQAWGLPK